MRRLVLVAMLVACRQPDVDDILIGDGGTVFFDATTDAHDGTVPDADAGVTFNGGGPFLCNDCICDGTLHFCELTDASVDAAEAGACPDASACQAFPIGCLPKPTCACLESYLGGCACSVDPSGNGLVVVCP